MNFMVFYIGKTHRIKKIYTKIFFLAKIKNQKLNNHFITFHVKNVLKITYNIAELMSSSSSVKTYDFLL